MSTDSTENASTQQRSGRHVLIIGAYPPSLVNFRGELIRQLVSSGAQVTAVAAQPEPQVAQQIAQLGAQFIQIPIHRNQSNPLQDLQTYFALRKLFKQLQPDAILAYTIKPVIWGGLAAKLCPQSRFVALITGAGFALQADLKTNAQGKGLMSGDHGGSDSEGEEVNGARLEGDDVNGGHLKEGLRTGGVGTGDDRVKAGLRTGGVGTERRTGGVKRRVLGGIARRLYKMALRRADAVVFQNRDNRDDFVHLGLVDSNKCHVVNGSGVDLDHFARQPLPDGPPTFLLIARLLREKGLYEFHRAARQVHQVYREARFAILGPADPSPDRVPLAVVEGWAAAGEVEYWGSTDDVRPALQSCHVYVLPSYHEGMPRTVLEAMATARPIITSDAPGCRETVVEGENGFLVPVADSTALARRLIWMIEHRDQWESMSATSRKLAEAKFDANSVAQALVEVVVG